MARDIRIEQDKLSTLWLSAIEKIVEKVVMSKVTINTYIEGSISQILTDNQYEVTLINGESYTLPCREGLSLAVGDIVLVAQVNGDINKRFIDCKRPY